MQAINTGSFVFALVAGPSLSYALNTDDLGTITREYDLGVMPADYAFGIWGAIYMCLLVFTVYQALPASSVPDRNDEFIYDTIGFLWMINMIANALWIPVFCLNTTLGFLGGEIIIIVMLGTALLMSKEANIVSSELNWTETIGIKWGTSLYSGWLSVATILNTAFLLKNTGISDGWNERSWSIGMLCVAAGIYMVNSYLNEDPVYPAVFVWALFGILNQNNADIETSVTVIIAVMITYIVGLTGMKYLA